MTDSVSLNDFMDPQGIAVAPDRTVFVADNGGNAIKKIAPTPRCCGTITTFASGVTGPTGVALDKAGNVFVTGQYFGGVIEYAPNGKPISRIRLGCYVETAVAIDKKRGVVYVACPWDNVIKQLTPMK
jgi:DNA-binding beta-propeller fold protein YncE